MSDTRFGDGQTTYAGFWWRALALLINSIISTLLVFVIAFVTGLLFANSSPELARSPGTLDSIGQVIGVVGGLLYYTCFKSSVLRATPGKLICAIKVVDEAGQRIGFGRALGRYLGKIVSALILGIGFMMAGWTHRKQALHDIMSGCLVIRMPRTVERLVLPAGSRI